MCPPPPPPRPPPPPPPRCANAVGGAANSTAAHTAASIVEDEDFIAVLLYEKRPQLRRQTHGEISLNICRAGGCGAGGRGWTHASFFHMKKLGGGRAWTGRLSSTIVNAAGREHSRPVVRR